MINHQKFNDALGVLRSRWQTFAGEEALDQIENSFKFEVDWCEYWRQRAVERDEAITVARQKHNRENEHLVLTNKFLQSQVDEWRLAHQRWSAEKLELEEHARYLAEDLRAAEDERDAFSLALHSIRKVLNVGIMHYHDRFASIKRILSGVHR